jgi:hypothetical protein
MLFRLVENATSHTLSSTGFKDIQAITLIVFGIYDHKGKANYSQTKLLIHTCCEYINTG